MLEPSDPSGGINRLAEAIKALTEGNSHGAKELAQGVYAATADWVPIQGSPTGRHKYEPQIIKAVAGSIVAMCDDNRSHAKDLSHVAFAFTFALREITEQLPDVSLELINTRVRLSDLADATIQLIEGDPDVARQQTQMLLGEIEPPKEWWDE